jgi:hypothetical protein
MRTLIIWVSLLYLVFCISFSALAETPSGVACFSFSEMAIRYKDTKKGEVIFHTPMSDYKPTVTDLACVVGVEFINRVDNVPNKAVIGIVSKDYRYFYAIQWNLDDNYFLIIESSFPGAITMNHDTEWLGTFTKYPYPLMRLKEIITKKPLPEPMSMRKVKMSFKLVKQLVNPTNE